MHTATKPSRRHAWKLAAGTLTLAVAASFAQSALAQPAGMGGPGMGGPGMGAGMGAGMGMGPMGGGGYPGMGMMAGGRHAERMLDSIGATADQKVQLRKIHETAFADMKPLREAGRKLHEQMRSQFAQPNVDANAIEALRQQLQANREQASKRMTQAMLDASRVLTPEQRKKLAERMEQRRSMAQRHRAEREALEGAPRRP